MPLPLAVFLAIALMVAIVLVFFFYVDPLLGIAAAIAGAVLTIQLLRAMYRAPVAAQKLWDQISFQD